MASNKESCTSLSAVWLPTSCSRLPKGRPIYLPHAFVVLVWCAFVVVVCMKFMVEHNVASRPSRCIKEGSGLFLPMHIRASFKSLGLKFLCLDISERVELLG